jgi:N-formylglutamate deformylase
MNAVGIGAVYTRTSTGAPLRDEEPDHRVELISSVFEPYGRALAELVDDRLLATASAVILDLHSFPQDPLPYELHPHEERPVTCLGADDRHTPAWLLEAARGVRAARQRRGQPALSRHVRSCAPLRPR